MAAELLNAFLNPDLPFLRYALFTGLLASIAFGCIGSFVVVRRISYLAGAISHCVLAGIGAGLYLKFVVGISWFEPIYGAVIVALLAAIILAAISGQSSEREDSIIGALWAGGMAIGLLFIAKTPGYFDPMSYLFGNILLISQKDILFVIILDILILGVIYKYYNKLTALCFDEEHAKLRGVQTRWLYLTLLCLVALTVVLMVRIVGIIMVIALLTLPAASAGRVAGSLKAMMILSTIICAVCITTGLGLSYILDLPSGPVIILIAVTVYFLSLFAGFKKG
jgi:zinc transport system permease protein